jgi:hypothetical protein
VSCSQRQRRRWPRASALPEGQRSFKKGKRCWGPNLGSPCTLGTHIANAHFCCMFPSLHIYHRIGRTTAQAVESTHVWLRNEMGHNNTLIHHKSHVQKCKTLPVQCKRCWTSPWLGSWLARVRLCELCVCVCVCYCVCDCVCALQ